MRDEAAKTGGPRHPRAGYQGLDAPFQTESKTFTSEQRTPPVIVDSSLSTPELLAAASAAANTPIPANSPPRVFPGNSTSRIVAGTPNPAPVVAKHDYDSSAHTVARPDAQNHEFESSSRTVVPGGEFNSSSRTVVGGPPDMSGQRVPSVITPVEDLLEDDNVRDATPTPMPLPPTPRPGKSGPTIASSAARGDSTTIDPQTNRFERGDPTVDASPDATEIEAAGSGRKRQLTGGTLRPSAALRRKRGLWGDVRYVFTAVFGVRRARRELEELERRQELRKTSRTRHLVTLGRTAVVTDALDHPALGKARDQLQRVEEERGKHAGAVAASDAELERVRRDRETKSKEFVDLTVKADGELAELAKKLEPLEKESAVAKRRGQELRETVQKLDKKIADTEALKVSVKGEKMDKASIQADVVTLRADKEAVLRDEPAIAAQLDALNPRIAAIEASRAELLQKKKDAQKAEDEDQKRTSELLAAIGAKRKVVERAAAEAEQARDNALLELGDRLYVDRPKTLSTLLSPIDAIDLELGEGDRRIMELREILSNIDRWKFSRGLAMIIVAVALTACFVWWLVAMLT